MNREEVIQLVMGVDWNKSKKQLRADIKKMQKQISSEYIDPIKVDIAPNIDDATFKRIKTTFAELQKDITMTASEMKKIKVSSAFDEDGRQIANVVANYTDKMGDAVRATARFDVETNKLIGDMKEVRTSTSVTEKKFKEYQESIRLTKLEYESLNKRIKQFGGNTHHKEAERLTKDMRSIAISAEMSDEAIKDKIKTLKNYGRELRTVSADARNQGKASLSMGNMVKNAFKAFSIWSAVTVAWYAMVRGMKQAFTASVEFEKALVDLNKVANLTDDALKRVGDTAFDMSKQFGQSGKSAVAMIAEFKKAGYEMKESIELARTSMELMNVGEVTVAESTGALISALENYNLEASQSVEVSDKLNEVSNKTSATVQGLANGLQRSAGTLAQTGTTIDENLGLLVAGFTTLRNMEKVSTGLITISTRLKKVAEGSEDAAEFAPKLEETFKSLGLSLLDSNWEFKNTYDIMQDLSTVYPQLNSLQQANLNFLVAGTRQAPVLTAILNDFALANKSVEASLNSQGSAFVENLAQMDSSSKKIDVMKSKWEQVSTAIAKSELVGGAATGLGNMADVLSGIFEGEGLRGGVIAQAESLEYLTDSLRGFEEGSENYAVTMEKITKLTDEYSGSVTGNIYTTLERAKETAKMTILLGDYVSHQKKVNEAVKKGTDLENPLIDVHLRTAEAREEDIKAMFEQNEGYYEALFLTGKLTGAVKDLYSEYRDGSIFQKKSVDNYNMLAEAIKADNAELEKSTGIIDVNKASNEEIARAIDKRNASLEVTIDLESKVAMSQEELAESFDGTNKAIDTFQSSATQMVNIYSDLDKGAKISTSSMLDLIQQYPDLGNEIVNINNSKENGLRITKLLFEAKKRESIATIVGLKEGIKAELEMAEVRLANLRLASKLGEITGITNDEYDEQFDAVSKLRKQNSSYSKSIALIESMTIGSIIAQNELNESVKGTGDAFSELKTEVEGYESTLESLKNQQESINELVDITVKLIEKESELYKEQLEDRKDSLDVLKDEADLQKELAGLNKDRSKLEVDLAKAKLDNSSNGRARILEIEDDLSKKKIEISDKLDNDAHNKQKQALEDEISMVENYLSKEGKIRSDAMTRINDNFKSGSMQLYEDLIDFNDIYGTSIESDIANAWESANLALSNYSNNLSSLNVESVTGSINDNMLKTQMALNSANWWLADSKEEKESLHEANKVLSEQLGGGTYNSGSGEWKMPNVESGASNLSSEKLNLSNDAINGLGGYKPADYSKQINSTTNNNSSPVSINSIIRVEGNVTPELLPKLQQSAEMIANAMKNVNGLRGMKEIGII